MGKKIQIEFEIHYSSLIRTGVIQERFQPRLQF